MLAALADAFDFRMIRIERDIFHFRSCQLTPAKPNSPVQFKRLCRTMSVELVPNGFTNTMFSVSIAAFGMLVISLYLGIGILRGIILKKRKRNLDFAAFFEK